MGYARKHCEILEYVNRKLVPIGYLSVNTFSSSMVHICDALFCNAPFRLDYREIIDDIAEGGPPRKGEATFYRAAWEHYGAFLAPPRDEAYWAEWRRRARRKVASR
jgi:hypothetical protein